MNGNLTSVPPSELYARLGTGSAPILIDVRRQDALGADGKLIIGAYHRPSEDVGRWFAGRWHTAPAQQYRTVAASLFQEASARSVSGRPVLLSLVRLTWITGRTVTELAW